MSVFDSKCALGISCAVLCWGAQADAQVAPVPYLMPVALFGFGGGARADNAADVYRNFPGFQAGDLGAGDLADWRARVPTGPFVRGDAGSVGLSGLGQFGGFGGLSYQSALAGYTFKGVGGVPVSIYAGIDTLTYNPGIGGPLAPFSTDGSIAAGSIARAGIALQPAPNVSLSFEAGFAQQPSGLVDSDIHSPLLPGQTPLFTGGRR